MADSARTRDELGWKKWAKRLTEYYRLLELYLSPDIFVVGGGVSKKHEKFFPYIEIETPIVLAVGRSAVAELEIMIEFSCMVSTV